MPTCPYWGRTNTTARSLSTTLKLTQTTPTRMRTWRGKSRLLARQDRYQLFCWTLTIKPYPWIICAINAYACVGLFATLFCDQTEWMLFSLLPLNFPSAFYSRKPLTPSAWVLGILAQAANGKVKFNKLDTKRAPLVPAAHAPESDSDSPTRFCNGCSGASFQTYKVQYCFNKVILSFVYIIKIDIKTKSCNRPTCLLVSAQVYGCGIRLDIYASPPLQEFQTLKKFGDSLLTRANKLNDISGQLDEAMKGDEASPHRDRVSKSLT